MVTMRILQLVVDGAGYYERKSQAIDAEALAVHGVDTWHWSTDGFVAEDGTRARRRQFLERANEADVVHLYAPREIPAASIRGIKPPCIAAGTPRKPRMPWTSAPVPALQLGADESTTPPEAVADDYRRSGAVVRTLNETRRYTIATYGPDRPGVRRMCEGAIGRIARFRDDIDWDIFDEPPSADSMRHADAWVDPTTDPEDLDGMIAEAQTLGIITIASRTPVNQKRLANGEAGFLVPPDDPNELAHAIVNALFRPQMTATKLARVDAAVWYAPARRAAKLIEIYSQVRHAVAR